MTYTKHLWNSGPAGGTLVTAAKLNEMEQGIEDGVASRAAFSVLDYGAIGDGITDDTAAFQAAMDAAEGGGTMLAPPRDYYVATGIIIRDGVTVSGYGARILKLVAADWLTSFYTLSIRGAGYGSGASGWRIAGFDFVGIPDVQTNAISLHHAQDYQIVDCRFIDAQGEFHAIDMQGCRRGLIERCQFLGYEPGAIDKEAIQIDHSYRGGGPLLPESSLDYSRYDGIGCRDITVRHCVAGRSATKAAPNLVGSHSFIDGNYHRRILIENNYLEVSIPQAAVSTDRRGAVHFVAAQDVTIRGNVFQCIASATQTAIRFRGNTTGFAAGQWQTTTPVSSTLASPMQPANITVRDNTFLDFSSTENGNLVHFWGVNDTVNFALLDGVTVSGNTFRNCAALAGGLDGVTLTYFQFSGNVTVEANHADKSRQFVYSDSSKNVVVTANTSRGSTFISFRAVGNDGTVISNNTVNGSDEFVLVETASTNTIISGNTFLSKVGAIRTDAIMFRGASVGFVVTGNIIRGGTGTMTYAVRTEGTSTGGVATGNLVGAGYGAAFSTEAGSSLTETGTVTA